MKAIFALTLFLSLFASAYAADFSDFCKSVKRKAEVADEELQSLKKSLYMGCQSDRDWMKKIRQSVCMGSSGEVDFKKLQSLNLPRAFYFSFDGAASFNAERALKVDPSIVNISGEEGNDLSVGNFHGGGVILNEVAHLSSNFKYESRYYSGSGMILSENYSKAIRCAKHIDEYLDVVEGLNLNNYQKPLMVAIGHSNGGIDAIRLQNELPEKNHRGFDLVLTIDPVAKALMYHSSKLKKYAGERNSMTGTFINYYQRVDHSSLGTEIDTQVFGNLYVGFKFKGSPVKGADLNYELTLENNEIFEHLEGFKSHLLIIGTVRMWDQFQCALEKRLPEHFISSQLICD